MRVVEVLRRDKDDLSDLFLLISDAIDSWPSSWPLKFAFVFREGNRLAHHMAKLAMRDRSDFVWIEEVPACAESILFLDTIL